MADSGIQRERASNLWTSFARKFEPVSRGTELVPDPPIDLGAIGGLAGPKEEIQTYACTANSPELYERWGTYPPSAMLLIGQRGVGKRLLAGALAGLTHTSFLHVRIPRLVLEVIHGGGKVGELVRAWSETLDEMPPTTVFFNELEFSQAQELGVRRPDLPVGPVMDFLLDVVDRTIASHDVLVVGSTSHPDTVRQAFAAPGRFERIIEVSPIFPDDVVEALQIHAAAAEKRAGHALFAEADWAEVVRQHRHPCIGDWVRVVHAVLRAKARREAAGEATGPVTTEDLVREVRRSKNVASRLSPLGGGTYV